MKDLDPIALFRLAVLGPLASRERFEHGELKRSIQRLAAQSYFTPQEKHVRFSEKTIAAWYYAWKRGGIEALAPKVRQDRGQSKLAPSLQEALLQAKRQNPRRSLNSLVRLLEMQGLVAKGELSRSSVHRLLQHHGLSRRHGDVSEAVERRSFVAEQAGDLWQGDVMHGPKVAVNGRLRKTYLVSLIDDASRLMAHSAFCTGETALDIEAVLKQAILKRGLPKKLLIDNGPAYRSKTLQDICARLEIRLIYCSPYEPQAKGKLEKWHRTVRDQFLSELDLRRIRDLEDLNARLWAWLEQIYHATAHSALHGATPLQRYQRDLLHIRPLGLWASRIDQLFYHRHPRKVRKDGTVSFEGRFFEVPYELTGEPIVLVVDPHTDQVLSVESPDGQALGAATPLDKQANGQRKRRRPQHSPPENPSGIVAGPTLVELALHQHQGALRLSEQGADKQPSTDQEKHSCTDNTSD